MERQRPDKLTSTIILGIFAVIVLFAFVLLCMVDVGQMVNSLVESGQDQENAAAGIGFAFAAMFGVLAIIIVGFGLVLINLVPSIPCLIFSIKNRKSETKATKIISFIYDGIFGSAILLAIVKTIIFIIELKSNN